MTISDVTHALAALEMLAPWDGVGQDGPGLEAELARELARDHHLFGRELRAIARRVDCDDVLFAAIDEPMLLAVVHLTWTGRTELDARWPGTEIYASVEDWVTRCMQRDHLDCDDDA